MFSVSIPQAVSTVATRLILCHHLMANLSKSFNTASGKHCCNYSRQVSICRPETKVSIPQAVSTVATAGSRKPVFMRFQKVVLENLKP